MASLSSLYAEHEQDALIERMASPAAVADGGGGFDGIMEGTESGGMLDASDTQGDGKPGVIREFSAVFVKGSEDMEPLCLRFLRGNESVCLKKASLCSTNHGDGSMFDPRRGCIMVTQRPNVGSRSLVAYQDEVSPEVFILLEPQKNTPKVWKLTLEAAKKAGPNGSVIDMQTNLVKLQHVDGFRTPKDKQGQKKSVHDLEQLRKLDWSEADEKTEVEKWGEVKMSPLGEMVKIEPGLAGQDPTLPLEVMHKNITNVYEYAVATRENAAHLLHECQALTHLTSQRIDLLKGEMGDDENNELSDSIWGSIGVLYEAVQRLEEANGGDVFAADIDDLKEQTADLLTRLGSSMEKFEKLEGRVVESFKKMNRAFVVTNTKVVERLEDLEAKQAISSSPGNTVTGPKLSPDVIKRLGTMERLYTALEQRVKSSSKTNNGESSDVDRQYYEEQLEQLQEQIDDLAAEHKELLNRDDKGRVTFAGLGWLGEEDAEKWMEKHMPSMSFDEMYDFHVFLMHCAIKIRGGSKTDDFISKRKNMSQLGIQTDSEALALQAFCSDYPSIFYKDDIDCDGDDPSYLTAIPTVAAWSKPLRGVKARLEKEMGKRHNAGKHAIMNDKRVTAEGTRVLVEALGASKSFTTEFNKFADEMYTSLTSQSHFTPKKAWSLTTQMMHRVIMDINLVRSGAAERIKCADRRSTCVIMLYTIMRSHDVMQEYLDLEFKDHPAIASEYVKFLATNSGFEAVATIETKLNGLLERVSTLEQSNKELKRKNDVLSSSSDSQKKRLEAAEKKLRTLP